MMRRHSMLSPKITKKLKFDVKACESNSVLLMFDTFLDNLKLSLAKVVDQNKIA